MVDLQRTAVVLLLFVAVLLTACGAKPSPPPVGDGAIQLETVAVGLAKPLFLTHAGDGSGRLYVLEQAGRVRMIEGGALLEEPFLDLTDRVLSKGNEQGLLGLAFDPDFVTNGIFYVHYTGQAGQTVIARFRRVGLDSRKGDPQSEQVILTVAQPFANHNGGPILFGPDGYLYIGLGDGGSAGDPGNRAQNRETLLGKILRIDVRDQESYAVPPSNPFVGKDGRPEIWAYGLRNPWRISFDRETGDLWIGDVGQNKWEEINFQPASSPGGENYGWKVYEGSQVYSKGEAPGAVFPVAEYSHEETGGCSVTGGYRYRGQEIPSLVGTYLYADYCTGDMWGLRRVGDAWQVQTLLLTEANITSFGEDQAGELYVVDQRGSILRLRAAQQ